MKRTSKGSGRSLRACAVYGNIIAGFRCRWAAALYDDIRTAAETTRRRPLRALDALRFTLTGKPLPIARGVSNNFQADERHHAML